MTKYWKCNPTYFQNVAAGEVFCWWTSSRMLTHTMSDQLAGRSVIKSFYGKKFKYGTTRVVHKTVDPLWIKRCCFVNRPICPVLLSPFQPSNIDSPYVTVVHVNSHIISEKSHKKSVRFCEKVIITETIQFGTLISITNEPEDFLNRHFVVTVFCIINYSMVMHYFLPIPHYFSPSSTEIRVRRRFSHFLCRSSTHMVECSFSRAIFLFVGVRLNNRH
jgi:hypothetical protein